MNDFEDKSKGQVFYHPIEDLIIVWGPDGYIEGILGYTPYPAVLDLNIWVFIGDL